MKANSYNAIDSHIKKLKANLHTSMIAEVVEIVSEGEEIRYVNVVPVFDKHYKDGVKLIKSEIVGVPLLYPSGGGGIITFPVKVGDKVLLVFSQEDIEYFKEGSDKKQPKTRRKFSINDAVAFPCIYPTDTNLDPSNRHVEIKFKDSVIRINENSDVEIHSAANIIGTAKENIDVYAEGDILAEAEGKVAVTTGSTFSVTNPTEELVSLLSELIQTLENTTVNTVYGVSPLNSKPILATLKQRLDTFKE